MKLTQKELIRLQKETHLLEHGFYEKDVTYWWGKKAFTSCYKNEFGTIFFGGKPTKWGEEFKDCLTNNLVKAIVNRMWFREKFPEFFEEEKDA